MLHYGDLIPMEPRSANKPFDSMNHLFQVKWDGVRIVSIINNGQIKLQNRKQKPRTHVYPDFHQFPQWIKGKEAIIDGEMIVLKGGKPSFAGILKRDLKTDIAAIQVAAKQIPSTYIAFDLLFLNGEDLTSRSLEERLALLREIAIPNDYFQVIEDFPTGIGLFKVIEEQEMEGIVAKEKGSPYLVGKKTDYWVKVKRKKDIIAVVGGYTIKERRFSSLLMGAYLDGQFRYIGNVATGLTVNDTRALSIHLKELKIQHSPFVNSPKLYGVTTHWIQPILTAKIEFMEWTGHYQLRAPVILGFTKDQPTNCQLV